MTRRGPIITDAHGVVRRADAASLGVSTSTLETGAAGGRLAHPHRGVYVAADAGDLHAGLRAGMAHIGPEAVGVVGSAAIVHGLQGLPPSWRPQIALPPGLERVQRRGIELHFWDIPDRHIATVDGLRITAVIRTLADVCRVLQRHHAVGLVDSALAQGQITVDQFTEVLALMARRRNCVAGRRHLGEARVGAQSPGETRVRLMLTDAGLPPDRLQVPVHDAAGRLIGIGDLGYDLPDGGRLIIEFDGRSVHGLPAAVLDDRRRQNALLSQRGVTILRFAWEDTYSPAAIPGQVRPLLVAAGWRPR